MTARNPLVSVDWAKLREQATEAELRPLWQRVRRRGWLGLATPLVLVTVVVVGLKAVLLQDLKVVAESPLALLTAIVLGLVFLRWAGGRLLRSANGHQ